MKYIFQSLILILLVGSCKAQQGTQVTTYDPIVQQAKETSLYSAQIDWAIVNANYVALTQGKHTLEELKPGLQYLVNSLGDKHASFRSLPEHAIVVSFTGAIDTPDIRDGTFVNTVINDISAQFSYELLENGVGYLKVVGIGPGDIQEQANAIRKGLLELKEAGVKQWIVDLRYNGGGNMNPMMAGLAPLIGEGFVGGAANAQNELVFEYRNQAGQFYDTERLVCPMDNAPIIGADEKVVVLLSRYTISSGELVTVAFKGRDNTYFIGEPTAGYTTGNGYDPVRDDLVMLISQNVYVDRDQNRYYGKVGVDLEMEFVHTPEPSADEQIAAAIKWLKE